LLKIQANEELFNKWKLACMRLDSNKAIVQNDIESSKKEINDWWQTVDANVKEVLKVRKEIVDYIKSINA
jgi:hypothetical protein